MKDFVQVEGEAQVREYGETTEIKGHLKSIMET